MPTSERLGLKMRKNEPLLWDHFAVDFYTPFEYTDVKTLKIRHSAVLFTIAQRG